MLSSRVELVDPAGNDSAGGVFSSRVLRSWSQLGAAERELFLEEITILRSGPSPINSTL